MSWPWNLASNVISVFHKNKKMLWFSSETGCEELHCSYFSALAKK